MVYLQNCAGQIPVMQERTGAQNLAEQSCQQRIDLQQADGRQAQSQVPGVKLTGTINFEQLGRSECIQLFGRSSDHRVTSANVGNEDQSTLGLRSFEAQGDPIRSPVEVRNDFAKPTTEFGSHATDLSARDPFTLASCDATIPTDMDTFSAWQCLVISDEDDDENEIPFTVAMRTTRELHHTGYVCAADELWPAYVMDRMDMRPTALHLHKVMQHKSVKHVYDSNRRFNDSDHDESAMWDPDGTRIHGWTITMQHLEISEWCDQCEDGRIQAIGLHDMGKAGDTDVPLAGSIATASGTKRDIESTPESADGRAETSSAKRMRRACAGTVLEVPDGSNAAPMSVDGKSSAKLVPESLRYNDAKVQLELPVEASDALHFQSFNVRQVAAHVALNVHKSPAEHAAQAGSFDVRPVQRDNAKSVVPVQHASVEGRVEYGGAITNG